MLIIFVCGRFFAEAALGLHICILRKELKWYKSNIALFSTSFECANSTGCETISACWQASQWFEVLRY